MAHLPNRLACTLLDNGSGHLLHGNRFISNENNLVALCFSIGQSLQGELSVTINKSSGTSALAQSQECFLAHAGRRPWHPLLHLLNALHYQESCDSMNMLFLTNNSTHRSFNLTTMVSPTEAQFSLIFSFFFFLNNYFIPFNCKQWHYLGEPIDYFTVTCEHTHTEWK